MPSIEIADQASFVKLTGAAFGGQQGGGIRGKVRGFSGASRKRLLDFLNSVDEKALAQALFVTLTYPDQFSEEPERWKRDLDTFCKRLVRKFPLVSAVWRLETQERKSGENAGKVAPHFHLLVFGLKVLPKELLSRWWYEIVGSGDPKHLVAGTQVMRVRSRRGILWYASKYIAKTEQAPELEAGRVWGIEGRGNLPVYVVRAVIDWEEFYKVRRVLRGWLSHKLKRRVTWATMRGQGMTAYLDSDTAGRLLAWAMM